MEEAREEGAVRRVEHQVAFVKKGENRPSYWMPECGVVGEET